MIPAASPRQPQWSAATPPSPASITGRQSATWTSGVRSGFEVACPSERGGLAIGREKGFGRGATSRRRTTVSCA